MTPGPTLILMPRGCRTPVTCRTIASGNTFGARFWTDGKREAPMLPDEPSLLKHPAEQILFWKNQCEEIGQITVWSKTPSNPEWNHLAEAVEPNEDDYLKALDSPLCKSKKHSKYVRIRLWWLGNDPIRRKKAGNLSTLQQENLEQLLLLLKEDHHESRLMKAEILRELSRFEEALPLLDAPFPKGYETAVKRIQKLAKAKKSLVATFS